VDGVSYEAYDPDINRPIDRIFVAGWSREASSGLVGIARKDGENGARAILQYLADVPHLKNQAEILKELNEHLSRSGKPVVTKTDLVRLEQVEREEADRRGVEDFKIGDNQAMLAAMGLAQPPVSAPSGPVPSAGQGSGVSLRGA
jgi:ferredoxin--NADP+ reductase